MIGQTISHYRIVEKLGKGGMGVVYKAEDTKLRRTVALKFLPSHLTADEEAKERFIHEAQAASALQHSSICTVHDIDQTDDNQMFIVMDYYDGETLKARIDREPLSISEALKVLDQVSDGLAKAHRKGIIHRDLKPANIILTTDGVAKILDFGLAKLTGRTLLTAPGTTLGTIAYMSPEQVQSASLDKRSDLFSLGVVLYEMLTGQRPFRGDHEAAVLYSIINVDPPRPSSLRSDLPSTLDNIVLHLLEKSPEKRYQDAAELRKDLDQLQPRAPDTQPIGFRKGFLRVAIPITVVVATAIILIFTWGRLGIGVSQRTVVVLPFVNLTTDSLSRDLCAGLTSTLTSKLSQVEQFVQNLSIVPASSVRESHIRSPEEARSKFAATHVVSGELQLVNQQVRVTVNLIDAVKIDQIGSAVGVYRVSDIAEVQDWTAEKLAGLLKIDLGEPLKATIIGGSTRNSDAFRFYSQGRDYLARHEQVANIDISIQLFQRALEKDSAYGLAYAGLGEAYWRKYSATKDLRWTGLAHRACSRALELTPGLAETYVTVGLIHNGTGEYRLAITEFQRALDRGKHNADALIGLGNAYEFLGDTTRADSAYQLAIETAPGYWNAYNNYGVFLLGRGNLGAAITQFKMVTDLAPDNVRGYNNLGGALMYMNRWEEAKVVLEKSLSVRPSLAATSNLATIYLSKERDYKKAAAMYAQATVLNPLDYRIWANLGASYSALGDPDKSVKAYKRAIDIALTNLAVNPKDGELLGDVAKFYGAAGRQDSSRWYLETALSSGNVSTPMIVQFIATCEGLGMRKVALLWVERAFKSGLEPEFLETGNAFLNLVNSQEYKEIKSRFQSGR